MTKTMLSIAALATAAFAAPAFAGGFAEPAPAPFIPAPAPVVVQQPELSWTGPSVGVRLGYGAVDVDAGGASFDEYGPVYGVSAAYDYDFGNVVAGVGLSVDKVNIGVAGADIDGVARIGGRLGADLGNSLLYGTAGYAKVFTDNGGVGDSGGYFAGVGSELRLTANTSLGAEILYHSFDDFDAAGVEADALTSTLSLNFRF